MLRREDREAALSAVLFSSLPEALAERLLDRAAAAKAARGETLFVQGDAADAVFVVLDGWVKLYRMTAAGGEAVVGVFTRGRSFGEAPALEGGVYPVSAEAVTDCRLLRLRTHVLVEEMVANPALCRAMVASTFRHLHALVSQIEELKALTASQRVAEFLISLAQREEGACTVKLPYDKMLIAGRLGMKPESLSRAFARLREHGVVVKQSHAAIADIKRLRAALDQSGEGGWRDAQ